MHVVELYFRRTAPADPDEGRDAVGFYLAALRKNGQVINCDYPFLEEDDGYRAIVTLPVEDALTAAPVSNWLPECLNRLERQGVLAPEVRLLGIEAESFDPCPCESRTGFILFTTCLVLESPLRCLDCFRPVPLYAIPPTGVSDDFYDILRWQTNYRSCDYLQLHCGFGERYGLRQMGDPNSGLSQEGRDICEKIEKSTGLPVYYYLHRYRMRKRAGDAEHPCPRCGGAWALAEPLHDLFDFRCDACHLLSNLPAS